jgi:hypothetical protein
VALVVIEIFVATLVNGVILLTDLEPGNDPELAKRADESLPLE